MTPPTNQIDERLDEWGSRLFNVSTETLPRPPRSTRNDNDARRPSAAVSASGAVKEIAVGTAGRHVVPAAWMRSILSHVRDSGALGSALYDAL